MNRLKITDWVFLAVIVALSLVCGQGCVPVDNSDDDDDDECAEVSTDTLDTYNPLICKDEVDGVKMWTAHAGMQCELLAAEVSAAYLTCTGWNEEIFGLGWDMRTSCFQSYGLDRCIPAQNIEYCIQKTWEWVAAGCDFDHAFPADGSPCANILDGIAKTTKGLR